MTPYIGMLIKPRDTIQALVDRATSWRSEHTILIIILAGIAAKLSDQMMDLDIAEHSFAGIIGLSIVGGAIGGIVSVFLFGLVLHQTGKVFDGQASREDIIIAVGWAEVPIVWSLLLSIPAIAVFGHSIFSEDLFEDASSVNHLYFFMALSLVHAVLYFWTFINYMIAVSQVQKFTLLKALGNILLSSIVLLVPLIILASFFM